MQSLIELKSSSHMLWTVLAAHVMQRSARTQKNYIATLREFCEVFQLHLGSTCAAEFFMNASHAAVITYRTHIETRSGVKPREGGVDKEYYASAATIAKKLSIVRWLFGVLEKEKLIPRNPFHFVRVPNAKRERRQITYTINQEGVKKLFLSCDTGRKGLQERAILSCFFGGGLRRSEVAQIRICDLHTTMGGSHYIRLRQTKAQMDVDQPMPSWAFEFIEAWAESRIENGATNDEFLFCAVRKKGDRQGISDSQIRRHFKKLVKRAGLDTRLYSTHSARKSVVTKLFLEGHSAIAIQRFARHSQLAATQIYFDEMSNLQDSIAKTVEWGVLRGVARDKLTVERVKKVVA